MLASNPNVNTHGLSVEAKSPKDLHFQIEKYNFIASGITFEKEHKTNDQTKNDRRGQG